MPNLPEAPIIGLNEVVAGQTAAIGDVTDINLRKQILSEQIATKVFGLFKLSVVSMWLVTAGLAIVDARFIAYEVVEPAERLITESVIMSVIGATIVQVGAASVAIVYSLFKTAPQPED
jgi:hypothetical protein